VQSRGRIEPLATGFDQPFDHQLLVESLGTRERVACLHRTRCARPRPASSRSRQPPRTSEHDNPAAVAVVRSVSAAHSRWTPGSPAVDAVAVAWAGAWIDGHASSDDIIERGGQVVSHVRDARTRRVQMPEAHRPTAPAGERIGARETAIASAATSTRRCSGSAGVRGFVRATRTADRSRTDRQRSLRGRRRLPLVPRVAAR
jgi:hypothetical protein